MSATPQPPPRDAIRLDPWQPTASTNVILIYEDYPVIFPPENGRLADVVIQTVDKTAAAKPPALDNARPAVVVFTSTIGCGYELLVDPVGSNQPKLQHIYYERSADEVSTLLTKLFEQRTTTTASPSPPLTVVVDDTAVIHDLLMQRTDDNGLKKCILHGHSVHMTVILAMTMRHIHLFRRDGHSLTELMRLPINLRKQVDTVMLVFDDKCYPMHIIDDMCLLIGDYVSPTSPLTDVQVSHAVCHHMPGPTELSITSLVVSSSSPKHESYLVSRVLDRTLGRRVRRVFGMLDHTKPDILSHFENIIMTNSVNTIESFFKRNARRQQPSPEPYVSVFDE
jgi:hypothetical protein